MIVQTKREIERVADTLWFFKGSVKTNKIWDATPLSNDDETTIPIIITEINWNLTKGKKVT